MKQISWRISRYLIQAIFPYFIFSWLLLSVILFVQQASRYSDIFFSVNIPKTIIWQLTIALVPNVIAFTCPMAILVGVTIGLARMQGDNELIAIRSSGVGNFQITFPIFLMALLLSLFTFFINLYGIPFAAGIVRKVALQTALYKFESPIEPGVFNTEIDGYTIYVKDGDFNKGTWKKIFIYNEDAQNQIVRLITSSSGRIDTRQNESELVLTNALVSTFSTVNQKEKLISENVGEVRIAIKTKREEVLEKIGKSEMVPEELGLKELSQFAENTAGKEKTEAQILWQRRIILSLSPLIFALLGTALVLRFNRGGRGVGIALALIILVAYYLLTLLGEQLARTNQISVLEAGMIPLAASFVVVSWFFIFNRFLINNTFGALGKPSKIHDPVKISKTPRRKFYINFNNGILDFDVIINLLTYFLQTLLFLTFIYIIFTAFELWKFAGEINNGFSLLLKYLFFLLPFIYLQLAPSALMIATLATFVIKSRQNEIVTWTAAGQSVYRLMLPCFILMIVVGFVNWGIQEKVLPETNKTQDQLRSQIRSQGKMTAKTGKYWVANNKRIYSFELDESKAGSYQKVLNLSIYEFSADDTKLQKIYLTPEAYWEKDKIKFSVGARQQTWDEGKVVVSPITNGEIEEETNPFGELYEKPSHLTTQEIKEQINNIESETERRTFMVAFEKKYTTLFLPFVITLFTAPFALSLTRKGRVVTVGYAVGLWLLFMVVSNAFEQFGLNGQISPAFAVWSPLFLFSIIGALFLSKVRT